MEENKKCWACKRALIGKSKVGLCSECLNKYGTPAATIGVLGIAIGGRKLLKNGGKIAKVAIKLIKH